MLLMGIHDRFMRAVSLLHNQTAGLELEAAASPSSVLSLYSLNESGGARQFLTAPTHGAAFANSVIAESSRIEGIVRGGGTDVAVELPPLLRHVVHGIVTDGESAVQQLLSTIAATTQSSPFNHTTALAVRRPLISVLSLFSWPDVASSEPTLRAIESAADAGIAVEIVCLAHDAVHSRTPGLMQAGAGARVPDQLARTGAALLRQVMRALPRRTHATWAEASAVSLSSSIRLRACWPALPPVSVGVACTGTSERVRQARSWAALHASSVPVTLEFADAAGDKEGARLLSIELAATCTSQDGAREQQERQSAQLLHQHSRGFESPSVGDAAGTRIATISSELLSPTFECVALVRLQCLPLDVFHGDAFDLTLRVLWCVPAEVRENNGGYGISTSAGTAGSIVGHSNASISSSSSSSSGGTWDGLLDALESADMGLVVREQSTAAYTCCVDNRSAGGEKTASTDGLATASQLLSAASAKHLRVCSRVYVILAAADEQPAGSAAQSTSTGAAANKYVNPASWTSIDFSSSSTSSSSSAGNSGGVYSITANSSVSSMPIGSSSGASRSLSSRMYRLHTRESLPPRVALRNSRTSSAAAPSLVMQSAESSTGAVGVASPSARAAAVEVAHSAATRDAAVHVNSAGSTNITYDNSAHGAHGRSGAIGSAHRSLLQQLHLPILHEYSPLLHSDGSRALLLASAALKQQQQLQPPQSHSQQAVQSSRALTNDTQSTARPHSASLNRDSASRTSAVSAGSVGASAAGAVTVSGNATVARSDSNSSSSSSRSVDSSERAMATTHFERQPASTATASVPAPLVSTGKRGAPKLSLISGQPSQKRKPNQPAATAVSAHSGAAAVAQAQPLKLQQQQQQGRLLQQQQGRLLPQQQKFSPATSSMTSSASVSVPGQQQQQQQQLLQPHSSLRTTRSANTSGSSAQSANTTSYSSSGHSDPRSGARESARGSAVTPRPSFVYEEDVVGSDLYSAEELSDGEGVMSSVATEAPSCLSNTAAFAQTAASSGLLGNNSLSRGQSATAAATHATFRSNASASVPCPRPVDECVGAVSTLRPSSSAKGTVSSLLPGAKHGGDGAASSGLTRRSSSTAASDGARGSNNRPAAATNGGASISSGSTGRLIRSSSTHAHTSPSSDDDASGTNQGAASFTSARGRDQKAAGAILSRRGQSVAVVESDSEDEGISSGGGGGGGPRTSMTTPQQRPSSSAFGKPNVRAVASSSRTSEAAPSAESISASSSAAAAAAVTTTVAAATASLELNQLNALFPETTFADIADAEGAFDGAEIDAFLAQDQSSDAQGERIRATTTSGAQLLEQGAVCVNTTQVRSANVDHGGGVYSIHADDSSGGDQSTTPFTAHAHTASGAVAAPAFNIATNGSVDASAFGIGPLSDDELALLLRELDASSSPTSGPVPLHERSLTRDDTPFDLSHSQDGADSDDADARTSTAGPTFETCTSTSTSAAGPSSLEKGIISNGAAGPSSLRSGPSTVAKQVRWLDNEGTNSSAHVSGDSSSSNSGGSSSHVLPFIPSLYASLNAAHEAGDAHTAAISRRGSRLLGTLTTPLPMREGPSVTGSGTISDAPKGGAAASTSEHVGAPAPASAHPSSRRSSSTVIGTDAAVTSKEAASAGGGRSPWSWAE